MENRLKIKKSTALNPPSISRIEWFEKSHEVKLPKSYVDFLGAHNGAVPISAVFPNGKRERMIERFLAILENPKENGEDGWYDISVVLTQIDERIICDEDSTGYELIPIAALFGGDFACLDFRNNKDEPGIVVWDHEMSDEFSPVIEPIADSFLEFLSTMED